METAGNSPLETTCPGNGVHWKQRVIQNDIKTAAVRKSRTLCDQVTEFIQRVTLTHYSKKEKKLLKILKK